MGKLGKCCVSVVLAVGVFVFMAGICAFAEGIEGKVNINTGTESQLALLPGVGSKLAAEIIRHRTSNGNFKTLDDIKKVSGIADKKFEKIRDFITLDGDSTIKAVKAEVEKEKKEIKSEAKK
ncbi:MAG: helix-hairpin-helix domain-containing protein [Planctomycetes bacterium]|nr:helix-hairpin-helix domain-containing protein [Planctomycetota bacterium]